VNSAESVATAVAQLDAVVGRKGVKTCVDRVVGILVVGVVVV